ncbi:DNA-binding LytR/AlgR family response regulator [Sphingomonas kyeonggiensis]|uniref:DNA-binding LytR/AlgR family response regulator n=1 Tax=Sphingomonas kyeonggiensis TaxID=1268553 RepID=A0A7W7NUJ6_9SPHN|nr:LytTR family DNA-binding domain-containing protein [Sphingomonas kyeonggiensis]MBB4840874.1 DNA-binding LytR/AlgR family response regulator [Sphingomonas kyeonggiensis]
MLVDDEPKATMLLSMQLAEMDDVTVVGTAADGDAAFAAVSQLRPDLVFLDIEMPGRSGIEVARRLIATSKVEVIFVTAFSDFAAEAFNLEAVDYLLKPVRPDRLRETLRRARRRLQQRTGAHPSTAAGQDTIWVPSRHGGVRVSISDIRRIEAARDYALLYTDTHTHIIRTTMRDLEQKLDSRQLLRIQRSLFVRPDIVVRVERSGRRISRVETDDGAILEVGASYASRVAQALDPNGELLPPPRRPSEAQQSAD